MLNKLFGELYQKNANNRECAFCNKEVGFLNKSKFNGAILCIECRNNISPWLDRKSCNKRELVLEHLKYREGNKHRFDNFEDTHVFGEMDVLHIDEDDACFYVQHSSNDKTRNPDIIDCSMIINCSLDITEEVMEAEPDSAVEKLVSYISPNYIFEHNFYLVIQIKHPWINTLKIKLNKEVIELKTTAKRGTVAVSPRSTNPLYQKYEKMSLEAKHVLENGRLRSRELKKIKQILNCSHCGAKISSINSKFCEYCGTQIVI